MLPENWVERYGFGFAPLECSGYGTELTNSALGREKRVLLIKDLRKLTDSVLWLSSFRTDASRGSFLLPGVK